MQLQLNYSKIYTGKLNQDGQLCNFYAPLFNLQNEDTALLGDFTTEKLDFDLEHPVDIEVQPAYDGAVNLILNDGKNVPRLINTRFSVLGDNMFRVTDHTGFKDTNIYEESQFDIDASLKTIAVKIPKVTFNGLIDNGGQMPCGSYSFYFKLADADGNETEILAESGIVQCHIGKTNDPSSIRMGLMDENTDKAIKLQLSNIDAGFDYVHVYYARKSSSQSAKVDTAYYKIQFDYPVLFNGTANITITGAETIIQIPQNQLQTNYASIDSSKTQAISNNVLLLGNLNAPYRDYAKLQQISWKIVISAKNNTDIVGTLDANYIDQKSGSKDYGYCYYNTKNVYYRVGYWPDEVYRFGIVYVFNDNSLSPVMNLQGVDLSLFDGAPDANYWFEKTTTTVDGSVTYREHLVEPEDFYFNEAYKMNSKGVVHMPKISAYNSNNGIFAPSPISINFDMQYIGFEQGSYVNSIPEKWEKVLVDLDVKGFFFVRLKRIPTILGQGVVIGKTDKDRGALPVLMNTDDPNGSIFYYQSFLASGEHTQETHWPQWIPDKITVYKNKLQSQAITSKHSINMEESTEMEACLDGVNSTICTCNAMLMPEAEVQEGIFNDLFCSNKYTLAKYGTFSFNHEDIEKTISVQKFSNIIFSPSSNFIAKLTNIPEGTKIKTDGTEYFSAEAGSAAEAYKTSDMLWPWNKTVPQNLTHSTSVVRGQWGSYVGIGLEGDSTLNYGEVYNIKNESFATDNGLNLCFQQYFQSNEMFYAISDRIAIEDSNAEIKCFRGDCFPSLFTHRMFHNFIDPELPTNDKIVDPMCWESNYLVRNSLYVQKGHGGINFSSKEVVIDTDTKQLVPEGCVETEKNQESFANALVQSFEVCLIQDETLGAVFKPGDIKLSTNVEQEISPAGAVLKTIFKPMSGAWETHGITSINRADVNAVGLGQWITFPICSSLNLAMRDVDFTNATEEASFNRKRSFYPLNKMDVNNPLSDSKIINAAAKVSIPDRSYINYPNLPYNKQEFHTRIQYSQIDTAGSFTNQFKVLLEDAYVDYPKTLGEIVKLVALGDYVYVICKHGIGLIQVRVDAKSGEDKLTAMQILSDTYGTMWKDSVIVTDNFIYGVDTIAKKIWQIQGAKVVIISDQKVEKFLIDNIDLSELTMKPYIGHINVKTHYNAFKHDVIFTYYNDIPIDANGQKLTNEYDIEKATWTDLQKKIDHWETGKLWSLCWNEATQCFQTFYDWTPIESANIDNIYFSFDREAANEITTTTSKEIRLPNDGYKGNFQIYGHLMNANVYDNIKNKQETVYRVKAKSTVTSSIEYDVSKSNNNACCYFYIKVETGTVQISTSGLSIQSTQKLTASNEWKLVYFTTSNSQGKIILTVTANGINPGSFLITPVCVKEISEEFNKITVETYPYTTNLEKTLTFRNNTNSLLLWKHGYAGLYDNQGEIRPTNWYGKQHEFNFEFVVRDNMPAQKIFNNLKLISSKVEPKKFEYEIVGEGYDWWPYKPIIQWINDQEQDASDPYKWYKYVLNNPVKDITDTFPSFPGWSKTAISKIPYLNIELTDRKGRKDRSYNTTDKWTDLGNNNEYQFNSGETVIKYDKQLNEYRIHDEQLINNMSKYGRIRGNAQYLEDFWDIEIRPLKFTWLGTSTTVLTHSAITADPSVMVSAQNGEVTQITIPTNGGGFKFTTPNSIDVNMTFMVKQTGNNSIDVYLNGSLAQTVKRKQTEVTLTLKPGQENYIEFSTIATIVPKTGNVLTINPLIQKTVEARHRDKYLKVKVRYSGTELAVIQAIQTMFDYSYA